MSLSLAITLNAILDLAIIGLVAFLMTRAGRLTPHTATARVERAAARTRVARRPAGTRAPRRQAVRVGA